MISLIRKDLRQLMPLILLFSTLTLLTIVMHLFVVRVDEQTFIGACDSWCLPDYHLVNGIVLALYCFVFAYSLYPHEHDLATINFLRSLPVSRLTIFLSKLLAAYVALIILMLFGYALLIFESVWNPSSLVGGWYPSITAGLMARDVVVYFIFLSYGMFLSCFRLLGIVLFVAVALLFAWLERVQLGVGGFNIFETLRIVYDGQRLVIPWKDIGWQLGIALILLCISYALWSRREPDRDRKRSSMRREKLKNAAWLIGGILAVAGISISQVDRLTTESRVDADIERRASEYVNFVFSKNTTARAENLINEADGIYDRVARVLGVNDRPTVRANLADRNDHFAGRATWKSLRMDLSSAHSAAYFERVFAHEVTHVFQFYESARRLHQFSNSTQFFVEGSAETVTAMALGEWDSRRRHHEIGAFTAVRYRVTFDDLVDGDALGKGLGLELLYSLGDLWSEALVSVCGRESIGDLLRAFADDRLSGRLHGVTLWQQVLASINCSLVEVNTAWNRRIVTLDEALDADAFPVFDNVKAERLESGLVRIKARLKQGTETGQLGEFSVRIRSVTTLGSEPHRVFPGSQSESDPAVVRFTVPAKAAARERLTLQLAWDSPGTTFPLVEETRTVLINQP